MRRLIAIVQTSVDGVMQGPGGPEEDTDGGFTRGGWFVAIADDEVIATANRIMSGRFDLVLGRRTYDIWTGYWPQHTDNPIGAAFATATKYVVTHRPESLGWGPAEAIGGDVVAQLRRLKASDGPELHIWGTQNVLQTLIPAGVIDEYRLWVAPVLLGEGKRLFETPVPNGGLTLVETHRTPKGVLMNTYRPAQQD